MVYLHIKVRFMITKLKFTSIKLWKMTGNRVSRIVSYFIKFEFSKI